MKMNKAASAVIFAMTMVTGTAVHAGTTPATLDLNGLKAKCNELLQNSQLKPFKAVVSCSQVTSEWRPATAQQPDSLDVANTKTIGASFTLKGYEVPFKSEDVAMAPTLASCNLLEQVKKTVPAVDIELECSALDAITTLAQLCEPAIDARLAADPSIETTELTGKTFNSCNH
ncbi:MAG: hypothetical protein H7249_01895 [Chitinophagaceae bacterium]|nr:hypothetical protein [Oligoflexus sp.]